MKNFGRHLFYGLLWVVVSGMLCLLVDISFAILQAAWVQYVGMLASLAAHILLMASCAQKAAREDAAACRSGNIRISPAKPALIGLCTLVPWEICYLVLAANPQSILVLNLFPLLQSPFLQVHRLLIGGAEPFSAIPAARRFCMALPPLMTGGAYYTGYRLFSMRDS